MKRNSKRTRASICLVLWASCGLSVVNASERRDVPAQVFGIDLGGRYVLGATDVSPPDGMPVKKMISWEKFLGAGIHLYVEPLQAYSAFPYLQQQDTSTEAPAKSNFRLYVWPDIPPSVRSFDEIDESTLRWEVASIEWRGELKAEEAYWWAMNLCESFKLDISVEPEILDYRDQNWYECKFVEGDRNFLVSSWISQTLSLKWNPDVFDEKNKAIEAHQRILELEDIRPY